nr:MAG TPA: hypothetical protein [Inoviridae sp.]
MFIIQKVIIHENIIKYNVKISKIMRNILINSIV